MGPPPAGSVDPLAPEHVAPLVVYLASPAGEAINGEVFVVHGGVAGLSSGAGFMCEDTLGLASETIGFPGFWWVRPGRGTGRSRR